MIHVAEGPRPKQLAFIILFTEVADLFAHNRLSLAWVVAAVLGQQVIFVDTRHLILLLLTTIKQGLRSRKEEFNKGKESKMRGVTYVVPRALEGRLSCLFTEGVVFVA